MTSVGIVVSTLGRVEAVDALLSSLEGQCRDGDRVVVVAQDRPSELARLVARHADAGLPVAMITSARGASRGRNAGAALLDRTVDVLHFPNDTSRYPRGALDALRGAVAATPLAALTPYGGDAPKAVLPVTGTPLDRYNAWSVIEMGLVIRADSFAELGGFDAEIGTGAATPWQAGEATDLVLRAFDRWGPGCLSWLPPTVLLEGIAESHGLNPRERRRKLRAYNRGLGMVVRRWRYPAWWVLAFVLGGLAWSLRHPGYALVDGWQVALGRAEGWVGRILGGSELQAVDR
ncbi:glycosyltransferase family 2 protein [Demequina capsici]|uniref:Glycosyltransferase family 2 protein n=1 Tax=Demequina capsici TaxID=3075620 RepID=A0AA96J701_9MICO|nr:hypothetical protein [Demequina sp. OYTSA14]WNM24732.1 hypothetical protein RN606_00860 [Demequina sp. OYTSA14]